MVAREDMIPSLVLCKQSILPVSEVSISWLTVRVVSSSVTLAGGSSDKASRTAWGGNVTLHQIMGNQDILDNNKDIWLLLKSLNSEKK